MTNDLAARLAAHRAGRGARYTRGRGPLRLLFSEPQEGRSEALRREHQIKRLTRAQKLLLVRSSRSGRGSAKRPAPLGPTPASH